MPITDILVKNANEFPDDVCLVEISPRVQEQGRKTWKEYALIESGRKNDFRGYEV